MSSKTDKPFLNGSFAERVELTAVESFLGISFEYESGMQSTSYLGFLVPSQLATPRPVILAPVILVKVRV